MSDNVSNLKKARPPWKRILALALLVLLVLAAVVLIAFRDRLNPGALRRMLRRIGCPSSLRPVLYCGFRPRSGMPLSC